MVDKKLLDILVCPETKKPLMLADSALVERLNKLISSGKIKDRSGRKVETLLQNGLLTKENSTCIYPVIDDIPVLLPEDSIPLDQIE